jgi:hypothetical protein
MTSMVERDTVGWAGREERSTAVTAARRVFSELSEGSVA